MSTTPEVHAPKSQDQATMLTHRTAQAFVPSAIHHPDTEYAMARLALLPVLWCFLRHAWGMPEGSRDLCAAPESSEETSLLQASVSGHYFPSSGFTGSDDRKKRRRKGFKIRKGRLGWRKKRLGKRTDQRQRRASLPAQPGQPGQWVKGGRGWHFVYTQERAAKPSRKHEMIATRTSGEPKP